jgi:uridine kinase
VTKPPYIVGITGGSCSGKTSIALGVAAGAGGRVLVLGLDSYYNDFTDVPDESIEVDVPEALDRSLLVEHVAALARGEPAEKPAYDYATHSRKSRGEWVEPGDCVLLEGLFALYWSEIRDLLRLAVFVTVDHDTALDRRIERDTRERGRTERSVRVQYRDKVRPNFDRFVLPTKDYAHLVVDGREPVGGSVQKILENLRANPG